VQFYDKNSLYKPALDFIFWSTVAKLHQKNAYRNWFDYIKFAYLFCLGFSHVAEYGVYAKFRCTNWSRIICAMIWKEKKLSHKTECTQTWNLETAFNWVWYLCHDLDREQSINQHRLEPWKLLSMQWERHTTSQLVSTCLGLPTEEAYAIFDELHKRPRHWKPQ
jgi:hypothetical protein